MRMSLLICCAALFSGSVMAAELAAAHASVPVEAEHGFPAALAPAYLGDLQQQLAARGYYGGPVDGRMSGALRAAVSVYQSDVGLRVTGVPDLAVINMLRFGPDIRATIQPLGVSAKLPVATEMAAPAPVPAPLPAATRGGVPPFEKIEPYRYPNPQAAVEETDAAEAVRCGGAVNVLRPPRADQRASRDEEPPLPKAAPQARVVTQNLSAGGK